MINILKISIILILIFNSSVLLNRTAAFFLADSNAIISEKSDYKTVSELRNSDVKEGILYFTADYGAGKWRYDRQDASMQDNTGTIIVTVWGQRLKRIFEGPLNVKWFGAKGDGTTDETAAFNQALQAVHDQKKDLYIPAGIYLCNKTDINKHLLVFNAGNTDHISIYGDGPNSKITSSLNSTSTIFYTYAYTKGNNFEIKNLFFENTHGIDSDYFTIGIFIQGTRGENFNNTLVSKCKFEGFATAIGAQGVSGLEISQDTFCSPKGHDNAQNNSKPAVYIWLYDNQNGYCITTKILNNYANGYSGNTPMSSLTTKRPMDGFLFATGYGFLISGNKTKNFSEEHIVISPPITFPITDKRIIISNNELDCAIPKGSKNKDSSIHSGNYAIRCDAGNAIITNNEIYNFTVGIMVRTYDFPNIKQREYEISHNNLFSAQDPVNYEVRAGITVQGSIANRLSNVKIIGNLISINNAAIKKPLNGIQVYDTDSAVVENNIIELSNLTFKNANRSNCYGIYYGRVSKVKNSDNTISGITPYNSLSSDDQVDFKKPPEN